MAAGDAHTYAALNVAFRRTAIDIGIKPEKASWR